MLAVARAAHTATPLPDDRVLPVGGCTRDSCEMVAEGVTVELFDPKIGTFLCIGMLASERVSHTATALADGRALSVGGYDERIKVTARAWVYTPAPMGAAARTFSSWPPPRR